MSTLAQIRTRLQVLLMDTGASVWDTDTLDEGIRRALDQYSQVIPLDTETVITLPGDGWEIALNALSGLLSVVRVYWPYDSSADPDDQESNRVKRWRLWWDDAQPVLELKTEADEMPETDDEVRVWYTKRQTIQNLDSASVTTFPDRHESGIVIGGAAHAALSRALDLVETSGTDMFQIVLLGTWARAKEREFSAWLRAIAQEAIQSGAPFEERWQLDKWDRVY